VRLQAPWLVGQAVEPELDAIDGAPGVAESVACPRVRQRHFARCAPSAMNCAWSKVITSAAAAGATVTAEQINALSAAITAMPTIRRAMPDRSARRGSAPPMRRMVGAGRGPASGD
jgi:hypothetical protein